MMMMMMMIWCY